MKENNFMEMVRKMRNLQKLYFKTRDMGVLKQSKHMEKMVDDTIDDYFNPRLL